MTQFVLPQYEGACLTNVLPSVAARLRGETPLVDLPAADRYVLFMVDGLGWHAVADHAGDSALLAPRLDVAQQLTCCVPSTTATSLTALGCGVSPGQHGVVGYSFLDPEADQVLNALTWEGGPRDVESFRCAQTVYEQLAAGGTNSACVSLARFADSALQRTAFTGTTFRGIRHESNVEEITGAVADALETSDLVYVYERQLDHDGHAHGIGSWRWLYRLGEVEELIRSVVDALPADTCLLVTGDHGMINVPSSRQLVAEEKVGFRDVRHFGGEPRLRHVYTERPAEVAARWRRRLGEQAEVWLGRDAVEAGWFGTVSDRVAPRIGDVVVAMREDWALHTTQRMREFGLVGQHGSLTPAEMYVPLFVFGGH